MGCRIIRLLPGHIASQPGNLILRLAYTGLRTGHLGLELRDLQHSERLSLANTIPDIDINMPDIAGNLAVNIDLLKGLKDAGDSKLLGDLPRSGSDDGNGRHGR